jgi:hypothetical protein
MLIEVTVEIFKAQALSNNFEKLLSLLLSPAAVLDKQPLVQSTLDK